MGGKESEVGEVSQVFQRMGVVIAKFGRVRGDLHKGNCTERVQELSSTMSYNTMARKGRPNILKRERKKRKNKLCMRRQKVVGKPIPLVSSSRYRPQTKKPKIKAER